MPKTTANAPKPDLYCAGEVGQVGELQEPSDKSPLHSFAVDLNPWQNGQKAKVFLKFFPEAFESTFDPASIEPDRELPGYFQRIREGIPTTEEHLANDLLYSKFSAHSKFIGSDAGDAFLQVAVGDAWDAYNEALLALERADKLNAESIRQVTSQFITGKPVIYRLKQQYRDGKLGQFYDIAAFYPATDENFKRFSRQGFKPGKRPAFSTFDFAEEAVEVA